MRAKTTMLNAFILATVALCFFACKKSTPPTVTISNNISVTQTSANVTGEVTDEGGSSVTDRGFIYGKQGESKQDTMFCGSGAGEFPTRLTGLDPKTTYNCFAFAKNDGGMGTSGKVTFTTRDYDLPIVTTSEVENVGVTTATCGGNAMDNGGTNVTERGVCWGTNHNPTASGSHASAGDGLGDFTCNITNLSANTKYYVRAYAKNNKGVGYGEEKCFTTLNLPTVSTGSVTSITTTSATGSGNVISTGGADVTERGICWSASHNPTISGSHANSGTGMGEFTVNMTNLTPNTTYYVRAYAINSQGQGYGEEVNFKTSQTPSYTVSVSSNPTNGGTVTGGGTYQQGQSCTVSATAASGYNFQKWTENGSQVSTSASYTFNVNGNRTLVAQFQTQSYTISASANPSSGGTVSGGGTYTFGQSCTVHAYANSGYTFANWTVNGYQVSTNANYTFTVTSNRSLVAHFTQQSQAPTGAINGRFSVSSGQQVYFSQGNLQYKASSGTWRFATNQYDYIGSANSNISSSYNGWIDLFGWGTSGWNCGNTYYRPWDSNVLCSECYGPPGNNNLTGSYANSDWGYYNAISNGGNQSQLWRTLTKSEWNYVFNTRGTSSGIRYAKAQVNNVNGVILLPDDWSSNFYNLSNTNQNDASFNSNVISSNTWNNSFQAHGAVFLPAAGYRYDGENGTIVFEVGIQGVYWSASYHSSESAFGVYFIDDDGLTIYGWGYYRHGGLSVRLVCPAQ